MNKAAIHRRKKLHACHAGSRAVALEQADDGEPDRIRPPWRARGEHAVRSVVARRHAGQLHAVGSIEHPDQDQMREALDVEQALFELRPDLDDAFGRVLRAEAFGNDVMLCGVRAMPMGRMVKERSTSETTASV